MFWWCNGKKTRSNDFAHVSTYVHILKYIRTQKTQRMRNVEQFHNIKKKGKFCVRNGFIKAFSCWFLIFLPTLFLSLSVQVCDLSVAHEVNVPYPIISMTWTTHVYNNIYKFCSSLNVYIYGWINNTRQRCTWYTMHAGIILFKYPSCVYACCNLKKNHNAVIISKKKK